MNRSIAGLIEALGGSSALARALGVPISTISDAKATGVINIRHWPGIIVLARRVVGLSWVDADALLRLNLRISGPYRLSR